VDKHQPAVSLDARVVCQSRDVIERSAWVPDRRGRIRVADELNRLVDRRLRRVRYFEIDYGDECPAWSGLDFHALDFWA
jgi:hypothetical protein